MTNRFDSDRHHRRSIRLKDYDYARAGAYFITICAYQRECLFGAVIDDAMRLNEYGEVVRAEWMRTADVRANVTLDAFVVMPNHVHGIIVIDVGTTRRAAPTQSVAPTNRSAGPRPGSIGAIVGQFKSIVTKRVNALRGTPGSPVWQRNYYEHVIRNERELHAIRQYIENNPLKWALDRDNPALIDDAWRKDARRGGTDKSSRRGESSRRGARRGARRGESPTRPYNARPPADEPPDTVDAYLRETGL